MRTQQILKTSSAVAESSSLHGWLCDITNVGLEKFANRMQVHSLCWESISLIGNAFRKRKSQNAALSMGKSPKAQHTSTTHKSHIRVNPSEHEAKM